MSRQRDGVLKPQEVAEVTALAPIEGAPNQGRSGLRSRPRRDEQEAVSYRPVAPFAFRGRSIDGSCIFSPDARLQAVTSAVPW